MKKYTDIELLETLLPMLHYCIDIHDIGDIIKFRILESTCHNIKKDFVVALQNRINEFTKKAKIKAIATNLITNEALKYNNDYDEKQKMDRACMLTEDNRDYKKEYKKIVKENHYLKVIIKSLLQEIEIIEIEGE